MTFKKSKGSYWYKNNNNKQPYNKCKCGNFKTVKSKKCWECSGVNPDGTLKIKPDEEKKFTANGYNYVFKPSHHRAKQNGYVQEHTIIAEKMIGRKLKSNELAHHKNKIRNDNDEKNLQVMTKKEHNKHHNPRTKHLSGKYYGKHLSHMLDNCICGRKKDTRSKICKYCWEVNKKSTK